MIRYANESAALALEINDRVGLAWALSVQAVGLGVLMQGAAVEARSKAEEALKMLREGSYGGWDLANALMRYAEFSSGSSWPVIGIVSHA